MYHLFSATNEILYSVSGCLSFPAACVSVVIICSWIEHCIVLDPLHWYLLYANYNINCPVAYYRLNSLTNDCFVMCLGLPVGGTVRETLLLRVLIQQSVIVFITEASVVFKLQGFRRENGGNRVPRTRGEHRPRHSRGSPVDVYVRRCVEAERAEQKNYIYTCHSAAERGVHPFQQGRIVENTGKFRHCAATVLLWCRRLSVAAGNAWRQSNMTCNVAECVWLSGKPWTLYSWQREDIVLCLYPSNGWGWTHSVSLCTCAFSALTLLVGWQEGHPACKNWVVGCWHGYLSGARCRLAYGPADATATHCLLLRWNPDWFFVSGTGLPG